MIGRSGEGGSGISVPAARHDDDDHNSNIAIQIYIKFIATMKEKESLLGFLTLVIQKCGQ